jgi:ferrochelatase
MIKKTKAVLLMNVGTPDQPDVKAVRRFLTQFLNDPYVIDIPWLFRKILVNLIIVPFRAPKSTKLYQQLWTPEGSPLLIHQKRLSKKLQETLGNEVQVYHAMRYGNPSLKMTLDEIRQNDYNECIIVPLFPQYASSTSETIIQFINAEIKKWKKKPNLRLIKQFYNHPGFLEAFEAQIKKAHPKNFDHVLFSFHGIPLRQVNKIHPSVKAEQCTCTEQMPDHGKYCYKATCYETARLLAQRMELKKTGYSVSFQSRLSKNWLQPFTDEYVIELARRGVKKLLVVIPSFVADCLESKVEIGIEARQIFLDAGGEELVMVESLNDSEHWVRGLTKIIIDKQVV